MGRPTAHEDAGHDDDSSVRAPYEDDEQWNSEDGGSPNWRWDWRRWESGYKSSWDWKDTTVDTEGVQWEDLETGLPDILPEIFQEEVVGWLLMRRSNLPAGSRLAIQAAAGNSLRFQDVERAMRQQEDELLQSERQNYHHPGHHGGKGARSFWIEQDGQWGLSTPAEPGMAGFLMVGMPGTGMMMSGMLRLILAG